ncbi:MAG: glycosyltransferase [Candidatus Zixiibacteriota bacterium]
MTPRITIAYIIDTIATSSAGTEKQLLLLLNNLDRGRFSPHLICLRGSKWLDENRLGVPVTVLGLKSLASFSAVRAFLQLRKYVRKNEIEIIQTFFVDANLFGTVAGFFSRVPVIVSSRRNVGMGYWHTPMWLRILRVLRRMTTCYIANSKFTANYSIDVERLDPARVHVVYNGLDFEKYERLNKDFRRQCREELGITDKEILIGIVANLRKIKNLSLFVEAARIVHAGHPDTRFVMVGEGEERGALESKIGDYGLTEVVKLTGQVTDPLPVLAAMDIAALCSKGESLSNSIIEYMACALAVVASDVDGNREALGEGNGLLFKSGDEKDFSEKIEQLILDPEMRKQLGQKARVHAHKTYGRAAALRRHQELYERYASSGAFTKR